MLGNLGVLLIVIVIMALAVSKIMGDNKKKTACSHCPYNQVCSNKAVCTSVPLMNTHSHNQGAE